MLRCLHQLNYGSCSLRTVHMQGSDCAFAFISLFKSQNNHHGNIPIIQMCKKKERKRLRDICQLDDAASAEVYLKSVF